MAGFTNYAYPPGRARVRRRGPASHRDDLRPRLSVDGEGRRDYPDRLWGVQTSRGRWPCRFGTTIRKRLPRSARSWPTSLKVSVVDINFGCPVKQVTEKAHSGSYLAAMPGHGRSIVERVVAACEPTPVTAKIRLGCTREQHQRNRSGTGGRVGGRRGNHRSRPHRRRISSRAPPIGSASPRSKNHLKRIPLIGNGDLTSPEAVVKRSSVTTLTA